MKSCFTISSLFLLFSTCVLAQDKVYLLQEKLLKVKILEVWPDYIVYQSPANTNKTETVQKKDIEKIIFANDHFEKYNKFRFRKDSSHFICFGIIPYVIGGRAVGTYLSYTNRRFMVDYRYTYTVPMGIPMREILDRDLFFYRGDNHFLVFSVRLKKRLSIALQLGYRNWWYSNVDLYPRAKFGSLYLFSSHMSGFNYGVELSRDISRFKFNGVFFTSFSITSFRGTRTREYPHIAAGIKVGRRIKLNKSKKDPL